jgi:hypothetical protein
MPDTIIEDGEHQKFMSVAPQIMVLANKVVEAHIPLANQSFEQAEDLYRLIDGVIAKWVQNTTERRGPNRNRLAATSQPTAWFRRRLDALKSPVKRTA